MATIRAAINGAWSNTATWIGGILPTAVDDVIANSFTIQVDGTYTVLSIRNDTTGGSTVGGTFNLNNGANLTCASSSGIIIGSTVTPCLTFNLSSPNSATFNGNVLTLLNSNTTGSNGFKAIQYSGTGTLNLVGNYNNDSGVTNTTKSIIFSNGTGIINVLGNITNSVSTATVNNPHFTLYNISSATINVTSTSCVGGGGNINTSAAIGMIGGGNLTLNCPTPIGGTTNPAVYNNSGGTVTFIGNPTASNNVSCLQNISTACSVIINGVPTASSGANAIVCLGLVRISGNVVNTNRYMAVYAPQITIDNTTSSWRFQQFAGGDITLYTPSAVSGAMPSQTDVRDSIVYAFGTMTGTLKVPSPTLVSIGVPTDNTVGSLSPSGATAAQVWDYLTSASVLAGSFGKLIKDYLDVAISSRSSQTSLNLIPTNPLLDNDVRVDAIKERTDKIPDYPASVQSTGEQIASYQT